MNTTHSPESPHHLGSRTKWASRVALAGALGLAVIGMGAGTANADPLPEINCPNGVVPAGQASTTTLAHWPEGTVTLSLEGGGHLGGGYNLPNFKTVTVDKTLAAPTTSQWYVTIPAVPAGVYHLTADETVPPPFNVRSADCWVNVQ